MKWIYKLALSLLLLAPVGAVAQSIDMAVEVDESTAELLGENTTLALKNKVSKIVNRNGMAASEGFFAVVPSIAITDEGTVDTGMTKMKVMSIDFSLAVKNVIDNTVFNSQIVSLRSSGKDQASCLRALVNMININDVRYAKLIKDSQLIINDFYAKKMPMLIAKIEAMVAQEKYDEAMAALSMIPDNVEQAAKVSEMKIAVYNKTLENDVIRIVADADLLVRQGKIDEALELCRTANKLSPNYHEVTAFLKRLDDQAAQAEAAALEAEARKQDAAKMQEKALADANLAGEQIKQEIVNKLNSKEPVSKSSGQKKSIGQILFGL